MQWLNDTFTGTPGVNIVGGHSGELGAATWAVQAGFGAIIDNTGGRIFAQTAAGTTFYPSGKASADSDYVEITFDVVTAQRLVLHSRVVISPWASYTADIDAAGTGLRIYRNNSTYTALGAVKAITLLPTGNVLRLKCTGTGTTVTIEATLNGTTWTETDTATNRLVAPGMVALGFTAAGSDTTGIHINQITAGDSAVASDTVKPTATSAAVANGAPTVVAITMSEAMDPAYIPAVSTFTVGGHTISSISISGTVISLTCATPFVNGEAASTVGYTQDGTNNLRDVSGNLLDNFSALAITNNVAASDTVAPAFSSAQVTNSQPSVILVTMNETLAASIPPTSAFTPSGGRSVTAVSISGTVASVTVDTPYVYGDVITVAYTQPAANPRLQDAAGNIADTFAAQSVTNNIAAPATFDTSKILFSPYNWDVQSGYAKTINPGAYLRLNFSGASCTLLFDTTGLVAPFPKLSYRVDGVGQWVITDLAASVAITLPTNYPSHHLELMVRSTTDAQSRWVSQAASVKLTGVTLASGGVLSKPPEQPLYGLYFGDSITEGTLTVNANPDVMLRSDAYQGWAYLSAKAIGAECGIVGFARQGLTVTGNPDVPVFGSTYNMLYSGVSRSFARAPDYVVINQGTNDGSANIQAAALAVLNNLLSALPVSTKVIVLRPFNGAGDAYWKAAIAACSAPARVIYVDTTGWYISANSTDGTHPNGFENISNLAPRTAAAIRAALAGAPTLTQRTVSITLGLDASSPAASLTGAMVAFYDEPTPNLYTAARFQTAAETCDANGVLTFTCGSTLPSGGTGGFVVQFADGKHYNGSVVVS